MPLKDVVLSVLSKNGLTTSMEIRRYFEEKNEAKKNITVQGYLQQRRKLNYEVFEYLNGEYLRDYYISKEAKLWNGYVVLAIDGSKAEVPNSDENRKSFGVSGNQHEKSESELAKRNIYAVHKIIKDKPLLVIFDRGYPSID